MTTESAPDIAKNYPGAGARIGPAWQNAWDRLGDFEWHRGSDLAAAVAADCNLADSTIKNLLRQARDNGIIEGEIRFAGKLGGYKSRTPTIRSAWYRRISPK